MNSNFSYLKDYCISFQKIKDDEKAFCVWIAKIWIKDSRCSERMIVVNLCWSFQGLKKKKKIGCEQTLWKRPTRLQPIQWSQYYIYPSGTCIDTVLPVRMEILVLFIDKWPTTSTYLSTFFIFCFVLISCVAPCSKF